MRSPYSGRTNVCAFSPQSHPYTWFTRASIGDSWGNELKRAGYDGVVITGKSDEPVHLVIDDERVTLQSASELWGVDTVDTQDAIQTQLGKRARSLTIGVAGERLSRIATIHTGSTSVAGQGGFGAVMGSKKLKAITVQGSGSVEVAHPERMRELYNAIGVEARSYKSSRARIERLNETLAQEGGGRARLSSCTAFCPSPCRLSLSGVQGRHFDRKWSGDLACVSNVFGGGTGPVYDWDFGVRGAFELNNHANRLGLNHWEILVGIVPWLHACGNLG